MVKARPAKNAGFPTRIIGVFPVTDTSPRF
jgi:hypothetical protein